jgi:hypothetical protein
MCFVIRKKYLHKYNALFTAVSLTSMLLSPRVNLRFGSAGRTLILSESQPQVQNWRTKSMFPRVYCKLLLGGLLSLGLANMAHADNGTLLAGNSACSQNVQSTGLYFIGGAPAKMTWTVWMSSTAIGPFTQIFETVEQNPAYYDVKPPKAGTYFFHACVDNTSSKAGYYGS